MPELIELLFFDTFAHDNTEEINLDLVQFPKPVYVTEVRIIPLGARVQADFPGGVRLGATNPSQFQIEFFVNDLGKPGASTFESLGGFEYNQNGCINLDCLPEETVRRIPTDGLVLKGWYTTITLAVYGTLTNNITEQIIQPKVNPALPTQPNTIAEAQQILPTTPGVENDWNPEAIQTVPPPTEYNPPSAATQYPPTYPQQPAEPAQPYPPQDFPDYFGDHPKDPRGYHGAGNPPEPEWDATKPRSSRADSERVRDRSKERERDRNHDKGYLRSHSRDRQSSRDYHDREKDWDRSSRTYRRSYNREDRHGDERKRPRTPQSPKRAPHTPPRKEPEKVLSEEDKIEEARTSDSHPPPDEPQIGQETDAEPPQLDLEEFEPILSDEDILDEEIDDYGPYLSNDDLIKSFLPGVANLRRFNGKSRYLLDEGDGGGKSLELDEDLKILIGIVDDFFKSSITKYRADTFGALNDEIKEEFVHLCEKLTSIFQSQDEFSLFVEIFTLLSREKSNFDRATVEMADQLSEILKNLSNWLKIALNYDLANSQAQPAYKIRHVKCGVRLVDFFSASGDFLRFLSDRHDLNLDEDLLKLYDQEFMALSIKLMILKSLDSYLSHEFTVNKFLRLGRNELSNENNYDDCGYKILVEKLIKNPPVRLKFALNSILKKLNLYESLHRLHQILKKFRNSPTEIWTAEETESISHILSQILSDLRNSFVFIQPKRFLPVSAQFEIVRNDSSELTVLMRYFDNFKLLQSFLLMLTSPQLSQSTLIKTGIFEILSELLATLQGLDYLKNNCETSNLLQKFLLMTFAETDEDYSLDVETKSRNLGMELAYKMETLYYLDSLTDLGQCTNYDIDDLEVIDQLQCLYCLVTFNSPGRYYCLEVLSMKRPVLSLFKYLEKMYPMKDKSETTTKSPGVGYIADIVISTVVGTTNVDFLQTNLEQLKTMTDYHYLFDSDNVSQKLIDLKCHLSPLLEGGTNPPPTYDSLGRFVEIVDKEGSDLAFVTSPGRLLTSLKVLHHFGISKYSKPASVTTTENCLTDFVELKYKHVILQLFSLDGVAILTKTLSKICDHYQQPWLHQSSFVSQHHGDVVVTVITCCVDLLRQMLTYVIKCRNTDFKDLTVLPVLFKAYDLAGNFPATCGASYFKAQKVCRTIIDTLLTFTQPISTEIHEKDSLNRTLWTMMLGEVLRYVTSLPCTFLTGLSILSELLPLPLPIQTKSPLTAEECLWTVNLRKLWSAHLHPHSAVINDSVGKLCQTSNQQLLNLLRRVCVQIGDLAANSAQMIAKSVLNTVQESLLSTVGIAPDASEKVSATNVRLLNFLACLVTHNTLKCAILSVLQSVKSYASVVQMFGQILTTRDLSTNHVQAQECVLSLIQTFCDVEVTLSSQPNQQQDGATSSGDLYLANALPGKDCLLVFVVMVLDHLSIAIVDSDGTGSSFVTLLPAARILLLLTEHDYGFYHLREQLLKRHDLFYKVLSKLSRDFSKDNAECLSTLNTVTEFLRLSMTDTDDLVCTLPYRPRSMKLSLDEVKSLISWPSDSGDKHPLLILEDNLITSSKDDVNFESLLESVQSVIKLLSNNQSEMSLASSIKNSDEVVLTEADTLLVQFAGRSVYISSTNDSTSCHNDDVRLWLLSTQTDDGECETITCDLADICKQLLKPDYNLVKEIVKLCRICPNETNPSASGGDEKEKLKDVKTKSKKPFVTPMRSRGFPRTVQQRSDLFRSRPPNTSRPPSLHVDDFVALETCGAQPTGPTGYNKFSREILATNRISSRGNRGRSFVTSERSVQCRQMSWWGTNLMRGPYQ